MIIDVPLFGLVVDESSALAEVTVEDSQGMLVVAMEADASVVVDNALLVPSIGACNCENEKLFLANI